jgi:hypothetical protein
MDTLREEIIQAQTARSDLLKWKLVLVGGVGAAGLGFAGAEGPAKADLVLAVIPPACVYVDLLCRHLSLRMLVIGAFIRGTTAAEARMLRDYETDVERKRPTFALEEWAIAWSTLVFSITVSGYGLYVLGDEVGWVFFGSGVVGILFTWLVWYRFDTLYRELDEREPGKFARLSGEVARLPGKFVRLLRSPLRERAHREKDPH